MRGTSLIACISSVVVGVASEVASAEPVYLSCIYDAGPPFAYGTPLTFSFDAGRGEVLLGDGTLARGTQVSETEISFLHTGPLHEGWVLIVIDRISGRFRTAVSTRAGLISAAGMCTLTSSRKF